MQIYTLSKHLIHLHRKYYPHTHKNTWQPKKHHNPTHTILCRRIARPKAQHFIKYAFRVGLITEALSDGVQRSQKRLKHWQRLKNRLRVYKIWRCGAMGQTLMAKGWNLCRHELVAGSKPATSTVPDAAIRMTSVLH